MKHTSGPWKISYNTTPGEFGTDTKIRSSDDSVIAVLHCNSKGNANLIASAPELLTMLERVLAEIDNGGLSLLTMEQALQAISKSKANPFIHICF